MKYEEFSVEDFLINESFQSFALGHIEQDKSFWLKWIAENPHKKVEANEALRILTSFSIKAIEPDPQVFESDFSKLQNKFQSLENSQKDARPTSTIKVWRIAASIALLVGISIAAYQYVSYFEKKASQIVVEKSVPKGRKLTFELPDGSIVKLNGDSYLKYEQNHLLKQRKITLQGEGFFEVARDTINPFTVISGNILTTALGTSFNIKSYPGEMRTEVYLVTGKVKVNDLINSSETSITLEPGDGAFYDVDNQKIIEYEFNRAEVLAWKDGIIKFTNANIDEVVKTLERWYGITIRVNNPPDESWKINGSFENESLENVMNNISYTTTLSYTLENNNLILTFKP